MFSSRSMRPLVSRSASRVSSNRAPSCSSVMCPPCPKGQRTDIGHYTLTLGATIRGDSRTCVRRSLRVQFDRNDKPRCRASAEEAGCWMLEEHDCIVLTDDVDDPGLKAGDVGTIVHVHRDGEAFEVELGAALLRWRPNQSLRRRRGRRQLDPSRRGEERQRARWPTVLLSSATDGGLPLVLARFVRGLSTHQGSGCLRRLRTAATAAKCHRAPVDSHRVADQMPTGPSMSRRRAPHAASPLPRG